MLKNIFNNIILKQAEKYASRKFVLFTIALIVFLFAFLYSIRHNNGILSEIIWGIIAILGTYAGSDVVEKKAVEVMEAFKSKKK